MKDYEDVDGEWQPLGRSPIERLAVPVAYYRWKVEKPGFQTIEAAGLNQNLKLDPVAAVPAGMVRVPGGQYSLRSLSEVSFDDFWLDRYEVTNRQFKAFVDAGGYGKREYWKQPFLRDGREIPLEKAMEKLRDATGRPGPASWELGSLPEGREDYPVDGVSWYEAAAYAEFAGFHEAAGLRVSVRALHHPPVRGGDSSDPDHLSRLQQGSSGLRRRLPALQELLFIRSNTARPPGRVEGRGFALLAQGKSQLCRRLWK
ncbi:MAG: formylglycine-generating enzyme family protein [Acidobacteria bacterium]|nr:formylglycine-generating enzyme family protein [Acidobacteriota bacterium]